MFQKTRQTNSKSLFSPQRFPQIPVTYKITGDLMLSAMSLSGKALLTKVEVKTATDAALTYSRQMLSTDSRLTTG